MKKRADRLLLEKGLCESRAQAQRLIMAGQVRVGADHVVRKTSETLPETVDLHVVQPYPWVSRGAEKLLAAVKAFNPPLHGAVALDVGASTGGFTDLMLQHGASRVYAVDVGYGQLHQKLREDNRVICLERLNARYLNANHIPELVDILTADVSFISLRKILPSCDPLMTPHAWAFLLIKPQFEASREDVGKGGVVRDAGVQRKCVTDICQFAQQQLHWEAIGTVPSPITGPKGNQEFVAAFRKDESVSS